MKEIYLAKLFEHNNWANQCIIKFCSALSDEQLDREPHSATKGTIRQKLVHLVNAQQRYLALLTMPVDDRPEPTRKFTELEEAARTSGAGLLALASGEAHQPLPARLQTTNGYDVEPWVIMVQVINHASEHREQISSMISSFDLTPLDLDGWSFGKEQKALVPIET